MRRAPRALSDFVAERVRRFSPNLLLSQRS